MKLTALIRADIYPDGGSCHASFETDDELGYSVWLRRSASPDNRGLHHRWLYCYRGTTRPANAVPIATGTDDERSVIDVIEGFLGSHSAQSSSHDSVEAARHFMRLRELLGCIRTREPCLPADLRAAGFLS